MKIEKLTIYGFGKHENTTIEFGSGINVLYGLNEAGKTTIQQFILHVLFGFPQRNSATLRYEPKSGGKYGGQVQLRDDSYGKCIIERVRGKSAGDVTVYFEDGTKGGEKELTLLLCQYDRTSFESIFSFSLLQLQGFEKMDEDELSRTLLASGTTGVDSLLQLEGQLEKEMGDLFKKSGKNPEMNVKIKELRELEAGLKEEQEKVAEYTPAIERIHEVDELLSSLRERNNERREQLQHLSRLRQLLPLYEKKKSFEIELTQLGTTSFPADGIRRFESLSGKLTEMKAKKKRIEDDLVEMAARLPEQQSEHITEIELLLAKESEWHKWRSEFAVLTDELKRLEGRKQRLFARLGIRGGDESVLFQADVSIRKEEEMHEIIHDMSELQTKIGVVESEMVSVENERTKAKAALESMEVPSPEEIERAEKWPGIRQQLAEAKAYVSFGRRQTAQSSRLLPIAILFIALILIGFGLIQQQWIVVFLGVIVGGMGIFLYPKKIMDEDSELEKMKQFIGRHDGHEREMAQLLLRIEAYSRERDRLEKVMQEQTIKYTTVREELKRLRIESDGAASLFDRFIHSYGFDGLPSRAIIPELFRMIREVQEVVRDMEGAGRQKEVIEGNMSARKLEIEKVVGQVASVEMVYEYLRREFIRLNEVAETEKSLTANIERLKPALKETSVLINSLQNSLQALLVDAGAETEADFYSAYDKHVEIIRIQEQLVNIDTQFAAGEQLNSLVNKTDVQLVQEATNIEAELSLLSKEADALMNEKAALVHKTEGLLEDEAYGRKRQLFEMKKEQIAQLAKEWSARKAVAEAIKRTMLELKETKLPEVLQRAEQMFCKLTGGKYEALTVTEEGIFEAVSAHGVRYPIAELSQATKEQAYISLRLALASSVQGTAPFPIIMDDPFVHFDWERLSRMIELLGNLQDHQFIYFTCHKAMTNKWADATIINVSEIGNEQGVII